MTRAGRDTTLGQASPGLESAPLNYHLREVGRGGQWPVSACEGIGAAHLPWEHGRPLPGPPPEPTNEAASWSLGLWRVSPACKDTPELSGVALAGAGSASTPGHRHGAAFHMCMCRATSAEAPQIREVPGRRKHFLLIHSCAFLSKYWGLNPGPLLWPHPQLFSFLETESP